MAASRPDTCEEHDRKVLLDAARQLEAAARRVRHICKATAEPTNTNTRYAGRELIEVRALIDAAMARLS